MNTNTISLESNKIIQNLSNKTTSVTNNSFINNNNFNSKLNARFTRISKKIKPESAIFTLIKLLVEHHDQIELVNSVLSINAEDIELVEKLNYCMEFLAHIPFSYQYNHVQKKIYIEFFHLEEEMDLINNLEIKNNS